MNFDFTVFKDKLAALEQFGKWIVAFDLVMRTWECTHDGRLAGLCIDQCCMMEEWYESCNSPYPLPDRAKIYAFVDEIAGYGLKYLRNEPYFLWRLAFWMKGNGGAEYILLNGKMDGITTKNFEEIAHRTMREAYELWNSPLVEALFRGMWDWQFTISDEIRARISADLKALNLRANMADQRIKYDYENLCAK